MTARSSTGDENVAYLGEVLQDKDRELDTVGRALTERDRRIDALDHAVAGRDGEIGTLTERVETLEGTVVDRDGQIEALHGVIDRRDGELAGVYASASWRVTKPLRAGKQALLGGGRAVSRGMRRVVRGALRISWRLLPLPPAAREALRRRALRWVPKAARPESRPFTPGRYVHSGWLDLADLHYEARKNDGGLPILFDPDWYRATYPDIRTAGTDPLAHYLEHGAVEGRWPVEIEADAVDPTIEALHRLDVGSEDAEAFDPALARVLHPELATLTDTELALVCGEGGARVGSKGRFVAELCENPREIPIDFQAAEYIRLYPDLRWLTDRSPLEALRHYMCHGRFEPRLHTLRADPAEPAPETAPGDEPATAPGRPERPLCVLVHVFYPELWEELSGYIRNLPGGRYDLYVNLVDDTFDAELLGRVRDAFPEARVYVSENVGRDIGGHFQLLRNLRVEDYRLFCLLHTKKSPHMAEGEVQRWRRKLLGPLLGTPGLRGEEHPGHARRRLHRVVGVGPVPILRDDREPREVRPAAGTPAGRGRHGGAGVPLRHDDVRAPGGAATGFRSRRGTRVRAQRRLRRGGRPRRSVGTRGGARLRRRGSRHGLSVRVALTEGDRAGLRGLS